MGLSDIKNIMNSPLFNRIEALKEHRARLIEERKRLEMLIANVEKQLICWKENNYDGQRKFEGFKQK